MQILTTPADLRRARAAVTGSLGLVPARGALHAGKLSLVACARAECEVVAVSLIGKHPPGPDDLERNLKLLEPLGVDLVWAPAQAVAYPPGFQTWVLVERISLPLEGKRHADHFQGFTALMAKLFNLLAPQRAYFGQIDAQRAALVRRIALDLDYTTDIVICPTVREPDGLAISSRNATLSSTERLAAAVLHRALATAQDAYAGGERDADTLRAILSSTLATEPLAREEYVSVADAGSLDELDQAAASALLSIAAHVGKVRLIDSVSLAN